MQSSEQVFSIIHERDRNTPNCAQFFVCNELKALKPAEMII